MKANLMPEDNHELKVPWNLWDVIYLSLFTFFLMILTSFSIKTIGLDTKNITISLFCNLLFLTTPVLIIFCAVKFYYKSSIIDSLALRISSENFEKYLKGGIIISLLIFISSTAISFVIVTITQKPLENPYSSYSLEKLQLISLMATTLVPFFEEIIFRGFIQPAACQAIGSIKGTIAVSLLFALLHQQYFGNIAAMLIIITLALILGFARLYFKSTVPGIIGHLLNNVYATICVFAGYYA